MIGKHFLTVFVLTALLLLGLQLRLSGIAAPSLHPDEPTIGRWLATHADQGELTERLYPGGFFALAAPVRRAALAWRGWCAERAFQAGAVDRVTVAWDDIRFARLFNVGFSLMTILCLFFFVFRLTENRLVALAAAAFVTFNPAHVEHSHYAETDIAMLFTLSLTLLLWTHALFTGRARFLLLGALAAGLAAGTKFTLVLLLVPLLAMPFASRDRDSCRRSLGRTFTLLGLALFLFLLALAWTNPIVWDPPRFMGGLRKQSEGLLAEMRLALGGAGQTPGQLALWRLRLLQKQAAELGPLFLFPAVLGLLIIPDSPRLRKAWPLLLLIPLSFLGMHLLASPFVRKQEFLAYLPFLALFAALPLSLPPGNRLLRPFLQGTAALVVLAALLGNVFDTRRVSGLFGWKDPRLMARDWNALHAPDDKTAAYERSAAPAADGSFASLIPLRHVADLREGVALLDRLPADYLLRDTFARGRGLTDPFTGQFRPRHAPLWTNFLARSQSIMAWEPSEFPRANASHAGHGVALYTLNPAPAAAAVRTLLADPVHVSEAGRETAFAGDSALGGGVAVLLTEQPRELAVGGPGNPAEVIWVTLNTEDREAEILLRVWGRTTRVTLPPWSVRTLMLHKPLWWQMPEPYARLRAWSAPLDNLYSPPCWLRLGRRAGAEAAYTLGHADKALRLLTEKELEEPLDLFRYAVRAGDWPLASEKQSDAVPAFDTLEKALNLPAGELAIRGLPATAYNDFARIRDLSLETRPVVLSADRIRKNTPAFTRSLKEWRLRRMGLPAKTGLSDSAYTPPFRLAAGHYRLRLAVRPLPGDSIEMSAGPDADRFQLMDARGRLLAEGKWAELSQKGNTAFDLVLPAAREETPEIFLVAPAPRALAIRRAELRWTLQDRLRAVHQDLAACFARAALQADDPAEALQWINRAGPDAWNAPELERLRAAAQGGPTNRTEAGFRFTPFYRIDRVEPSDGSLKISLTTLQDDTPPHLLQVVEKRRKVWKTLESLPLHPAHLREGERFTVSIPTGKGPSKDRGLRIRTGILTQPGALAVDDSDETVLPLSQLLIRNAP
ncbi:MAG: glycosyltransferase family 39 protein [Kiritimatiellia bacterium]